MSDLLILVLVEICYLITGFGLCVIGKNLIEKGFETKFEGEGVFGEKTIRIITTSPGLVFMVAGLIVITIAIYQTAEIREKIATTVSENTTEIARGQPEEHEDSSVTVPLTTLVERTVIFAQQNPNRNFAEQQINIAKAKVLAGKLDEASTYLAIAVVIDPSLLNQILQDQSLKPAIINPHFDAIVRARLSMPHQMEPLPRAQLSAAAGEILNRVHSIAEAQDQSKPVTNDIRNIVVSIPLDPQVEEREITIDKLIRLLSQEPRMLLEVLEEDGYQWLLHDEEILDSMLSAIDTYYRGQ